MVGGDGFGACPLKCYALWRDGSDEVVRRAAGADRRHGVAGGRGEWE